ncbi:MAG: carboxypeptidase regulatory-like domain-containing protein, partial [Acidobacteria bacterium]|nr:carboxypeptidase regulatory-like domain-containing protein [Acidobacteriota bacterium]
MRLLASLLFVSSLAAPLLAVDVTGWVLNEEGAPIGGARVTAHPAETTDQRRARWVKGDEPALLAETTADSKGQFRLRADLPLVVRVAAPGREPFGVSVPRDGELGALVLRRVPMESGSVSMAGSPLAGARVVFASLPGAEFVATTGDDGSFRAPAPQPMTSSAIVIHPAVGVTEVYGTRGIAPMEVSIGEPKTITGTVVLPDGSPAAGAEMSAYGWPLGTTDEEGRFEVRHAIPYVRTVRAQKGDLVALAAEAGSPLRLTLEPTHVLTGVVRDSRSNEPIPFAEVFASDTARGSAVAARADGRGQFRIENLPAGRYGVSAMGLPMSGPGGTPVTIPADRPLELKAAVPAPPVRGRVVDETGAPVVGAKVVGGMGGMALFDSSAAPRTAPDGSFILRNFQRRGGAMKSYLFAEAGGVIARSEALPEALEGPVTIVIPPAAPLAVSVRDRSGASIAGVAVATVRIWEGEPYNGVRAYVVSDSPRTDEKGTVDLRLAPGVYDLRIEGVGFVGRSLTGQRAEPRARVDVVLDPAAPLRGRVVRRDGTPVAGTSVRASSDSASVSAETPADGTFAILVLPPGEAQVQASNRGARIERTVTLPEEDLLLEFPMGGTVAGRVVDRATGAPITPFVVGPKWIGSMHASERGAWISSRDGTFELSGIAPGEIVLVVSADGYVPFWTEPLALEEEKTVGGIEVKLERGATVRGRVTGSAGEPIEGVSVGIDTRGKYGTTTHFYELNALTDASGEYVIPRVETGSKAITFSRQGYLPEKKTIDVSGAELRADAQFEKGGSLRGKVIDPARLPVAGARITVRGTEGSGGSWGSGESDASGAFVVGGLPRGLYDVEVEKEGYATATPRRVDPWTTSDLTIALGREAEIYGRVTGVPRSGNTMINVTAEIGGTKEHARADAAGNYRIRKLAGGDVALHAIVIESGNRTVTAKKRVKLPAGGEERVDFDITANSARGRITVNGLPAERAQVTFWA